VTATVTHNQVPTITEEVERVPAQVKTTSEAAAPLLEKPAAKAVPAPAVLKVQVIPAAALKAKPTAAAPAAGAIKPAPAAPVQAASSTVAPARAGPAVAKPAPAARVQVASSTVAPALAGPAVAKPAPESPAPAVKAAPGAGPAPIKALAASPPPTPVKPVVPAAVKPAGAALSAVQPMSHGVMSNPLKPAPLPPSAGRVTALREPLPNFESTQTLRPLTQLELEDDTISRWFVIQLSLAEEGFDPDSLPDLDIFGEYRLYSVPGTDQGKVMHALRLGFFAEEGAAAAVASYLSAYFEKPAIKRISTAERDRFSDQRVEARMDVGATGRHAVIEITSERVVRARRTTPTVMPMPARPAGVAGGGAPK
jgi:hypothetical protein